MDDLIESLEKKGVLRSASIKEALANIDRKDFVPADLAHLAYEDTALPIGQGQTISQPYTVVFMLELLAPKAGDHIMDVGHGSAWQTAILAEIVGEQGRVYAIELLEGLSKLGRENISKYPELLKRISFYCQDASPGLPEVGERIAGFDGIIAAAEVEDAPKAWREQLKTGGRLVYPQDQAIVREVKHGVGVFDVSRYPGFVFVPFVIGVKNS
ncbi:MAG: protein-L-isoaspartate O-methyltransferase [Candidatus Sungbacteria bacterium]|uniref:Protein-L-isoaspartate O-methyltransferase n=1 Tax=Candidatus Sungiibacteriota bacterium TaxID=2750080 RepID=A0A931SDJ2_9BACT|nr:protein-L-isoaspartate O-methyltransferase [Candidatus Sungbacteria bacterium]